MSRPYTPRDAEDLEVLAGRRGAKRDHAARLRDIEHLATNIARTRGINPDTQKAIDDLEKKIADDIAADRAAIQAELDKLEADLAAANLEIINAKDAAAAAHNTANAVTDKHNTLVGTFIGTLPERFSATDQKFTEVDQTTTSLSSDINGVKSDLTQNYYTAVATDEAISVESTKLSAEMNAVRIGDPPPSEYRIITDALGKLTAGSTAITIATAAGAFGHDASLTVTDTMATRSTTGTTSGAYAVIPAAKAAAYFGRRIRVSVLAKRVNETAAISAAYSANSAGSTALFALGTATEYAWRWFTGYIDVPASTGVTEDHYLGLFADGATSGKFDIVEINIVVAAEAGPLPKTLKTDVTDVLGANVNGLDGTALGVLFTQLEVDANGTSAKITTQGSAIADLEGNASAVYGIRVQANGAASILDLIAADGSGTTPVSIVKIGGDDILLDGSVSMEKLTVGTGRNLLPNADFRDLVGSRIMHWRHGGLGPQSSFKQRPAGQTWAFPSAPTAWIHQDGTTATEETHIYCDTENKSGSFAYGVPVEPGKTYEAQARVSAHRCTGRIYIRFADANGADVGTTSVAFGEGASSSTNPLVWPKHWVKATAPSTAVTARLILTKYGTLSGNADSHMFIAQPQVAETHSSAIRASQFSPGDTTVIDGGRIFTRSILTESLGANVVTANETNFASLGALGLTVSTADMIQKSVIEVVSANNGTRVTTTDGTWRKYMAVGANPSTVDTYDMYIFANIQGGGNGEIAAKVGTEYLLNYSIFTSAGFGTESAPLIAVKTGVSGSQTVELMHRGTDPDGDGSYAAYIDRATLTIQMVKR